MMLSELFDRAEHVERQLCVLANAVGRRRAMRGMFKLVSRLGDGIIWYLLIATLPWAMGTDGVALGLQMLLTGGIGQMLYKYLKQRFVRERPFVRLIGIECFTPPLDRYSFPSGHTLHAVCFTTVAVAHVPALAILLVPLTALIAASRVVLGLHYPSDVLVGAALGAALGAVSNAIA